MLFNFYFYIDGLQKIFRVSSLIKAIATDVPFTITRNARGDTLWDYRDDVKTILSVPDLNGRPFFRSSAVSNEPNPLFVKFLVLTLASEIKPSSKLVVAFVERCYYILLQSTVQLRAVC